MPSVRRSPWVFFYRHDGTFVDVPRLLEGSVELTPLRRTLAISILKGEEYVVSADELALLFAIPSDTWIASDEVATGSSATLERLARRGLVVTDDADEELTELRRRDQRLTDDQWHPYAALYHFLTRWRDVDVEQLPAWAGETGTATRLLNEADVAELVRRLGTPPRPFADVAGPHYELPLTRRRGRLYETLARRKTSRAFDARVPVTADELGTVLYYTFGCRGIAEAFGGLVAVKKTSPSGGALHPVEAYPLIANVEGIAPGLYHYDVESHALRLVETLSRNSARRLARHLTAGQSYFGAAHVLVVLAARFPRSFWKYRRHQRAYAVLLMDAGHLSQTFSLVCTELGLGAFVTAAVNGANAEERLGLDPTREGVLAIVGCGRPSAERSELEPEFAPFAPRRADS